MHAGEHASEMEGQNIMAIGSEGEVGVTFGRWGDMTEEAKEKWLHYMRTELHPWLYAGYATLHYPKRYPNGERPETSE
jgi:hypothetical protein